MTEKPVEVAVVGAQVTAEFEISFRMPPPAPGEPMKDAVQLPSGLWAVEARKECPCCLGDGGHDEDIPYCTECEGSGYVD